MIQQIELEYKDDLTRLESILKSQKQQKELFCNDIKNLRMKSRPLPPICTERKRLPAIHKKKENDSDTILYDAMEMEPEENVFAVDSVQFDNEDNEMNREFTQDDIVNTKTSDVEDENEGDTQTATMVCDIFNNLLFSDYNTKETILLYRCIVCFREL